MRIAMPWLASKSPLHDAQAVQCGMPERKREVRRWNDLSAPHLARLLALSARQPNRTCSPVAATDRVRSAAPSRADDQDQGAASGFGVDKVRRWRPSLDASNTTPAAVSAMMMARRLFMVVFRPCSNRTTVFLPTPARSASSEALQPTKARPARH